MRVVELRRPEDLAALKDPWRRLVEQSAGSKVFVTWEWATAWWSAYGDPGSLRLWVIVDDVGTPRAIVPLRAGTGRRYGLTVPVLSIAGDGSNDSDYLDLIVEPGFEAQVEEAIRGEAAKAMKAGWVLAFNEVAEDAACRAMLQQWSGRPGNLYTEAAVPCAVAALPESWDKYLGMLRPRFRTKVRSALRELEGRPGIHFGFAETPEAVSRLLPILFDLHTRRWNRDSRPGVFTSEAKKHFYSKLSELFLERGWLRFSYVMWNDRVLACQYGFLYNQVYSQLQEGYEPDCEHWNVGTALRAWSIQQLIAEGTRYYDFLGGWSRHKSDWGAEPGRNYQLQLARATWRNVLFCHGPRWEASARERVAGALPERVLALRKSLLQRNNNGEAASSPGAADAMRVAAARCYSSLSRPLRPIRERFSLNLRPAGGGPAISLARRTEPTLRILYYHRVNNDGDPFFPAISTELFEKQMRHLARNHTVVPLDTAVGHLRERRPGSLLAITFDDGYQDNHWNALPVLRRYRLPATIFLSTGGLDSREPLWFEHLAEAVKTSAESHIDVELDLPRRLRLGSIEERLAANDVLYGHLRQLPDRVRRERLAEFLKLLGYGESVRKDKMLTWDQVREMSRNGISFGGHTVNHPFLSKVTPQLAEWEVTASKQRIEEELQASVSLFAYPSGRESDVEEWNRNVLARAGYSVAVTTIWGPNFPSTDPLKLKRGQPWEPDPAVFASKLDWYQWVNG
jgi:peptidoglycan/xylan/chitin deacetylase (PgdA/CDA1 family)/CelD/BcsL family acetyltransferase involved in cellulose biosynthesis